MCLYMYILLYLKLLDGCSDGMVFGALPPCDTCGGQLVPHTHWYSCTGNISDWTKCTVTTTTVKRKKWIIPQDLKKEYLFLYVNNCNKLCVTMTCLYIGGCLLGRNTSMKKETEYFPTPHPLLLLIVPHPPLLLLTHQSMTFQLKLRHQ